MASHGYYGNIIYPTGLQQGDIMLCSSKNLSGVVIQSFEDSIWNHSAMIVHPNDINILSSAESTGVTTVPISYWYGKSDMVCIARPITPWTMNEMVKIMEKFFEYNNKAPYAYANCLFFQAIKYISIMILGKTIWLGRSYVTNKPKAFACGQWCMYLCNYARPALFPGWAKGAPPDIWGDTQNFRFYTLSES